MIALMLCERVFGRQLCDYYTCVMINRTILNRERAYKLRLLKNTASISLVDFLR